MIHKGILGKSIAQCMYTDSEDRLSVGKYYNVIDKSSKYKTITVVSDIDWYTICRASKFNIYPPIPLKKDFK